MTQTAKKAKGRPTGYRWKPPRSLSEKYFTRREAAEELGCSLRKLDVLVTTEQLDHVTYDGTHTLVSKASVRMYVAERTGDGLPPPQVKKAKGRGPRA